MLDRVRQELAGKGDLALLARLTRTAAALDVLIASDESMPLSKTTATLLYDNKDGQRIVHLSDLPDASGQFAIVRDVEGQSLPVVTYREDSFMMAADCL